MSILTKASRNTRCRGYEYFESKKVLSCDKISEYEYDGTVQGTMTEPYKVRINLDKTMSSSCTCPFANGRKICKHMVAVFCCVFPEEAQKYTGEYRDYTDEYSRKHYYDSFYDDFDDYDDDENCDEDYDEFEDMLRKCIKKLSKTQLQNALFDLLYDGTEEQLNLFLYNYTE